LPEDTERDEETRHGWDHGRDSGQQRLRGGALGGVEHADTHQGGHQRADERGDRADTPHSVQDGPGPARLRGAHADSPRIFAAIIATVPASLSTLASRFSTCPNWSSTPSTGRSVKSRLAVSFQWMSASILTTGTGTSEPP